MNLYLLTIRVSANVVYTHPPNKWGGGEFKMFVKNEYYGKTMQWFEKNAENKFVL